MDIKKLVYCLVRSLSLCLPDSSIDHGEAGLFYVRIDSIDLILSSSSSSNYLRARNYMVPIVVVLQPVVQQQLRTFLPNKTILA